MLHLELETSPYKEVSDANIWDFDCFYFPFSSHSKRIFGFTVIKQTKGLN